MLRAYAVAQVRAAEDRELARLPDGELMQRAASGLAQVVAARLESLDGAEARVVGLVGAGNNGGDTLFALAHLAATGYPAAAVIGAAPHPEGLQAARERGVVVVDGTDPGEDSSWREVLQEADVVLDGILGIGGRPGLRSPARDWVADIGPDAYVIAVDLPSGVDPEGRAGSSDSVFADETVTFGLAKPCHLLPASEPAVGRLTIVDIGLTGDDLAVDVERLDHADVADRWPAPSMTSDKYSRGVVGIVAGSSRYPGAAVLSVVGALGAGAGMGRYLGPTSVQALVHHHAPEAVTAPGRVQAWVLGPGIDPDAPDADDDGQVQRVREALSSDLPCLVDAGALTLVQRRDAPTLLTPHAGELAALLTRLGTVTSREDVVADPVGTARAAADALGAVVLLKGSTTLVVPPGSATMRSQVDAPPWLGTAGAGDVLAGLVGVLLAAGLDPLEAGSLGALVHGRAADRANPGGPVRALAVAHAIPATIAALLR